MKKRSRKPKLNMHQQVLPNNEKGQKNDCDTAEKISVKIEKINLIVAIASFVFSIFAIYVSWRTGKSIADYEFILSQIPKVCILNQEFQIPISINYDVDDYEYGGFYGAIDLEYVDDELFPLRIPIYNI